MTSEIITAVISLITGVFGWEGIKYMLNRDTNKRIAEVEAKKEELELEKTKRVAEVEADSIEFNFLREHAEFMQEQVLEKEKRFAEQTQHVRELNNTVLELTKEKGKLELELQRYRCVRPKCPNRDPQNGF